MKRKRIIAVLLCLLMMMQALSAFCLTTFAEGETETSSNVLDDLHRDESFDEAAYPDNPDDLSLQVITIAESTTWELLVYVYQPAAATQPLTATSINISRSHDAIQFKNYTLTLLSQEGVFQKYKVNDFAVEGASIRYYEITNIYRDPIDASEYSTGIEDGNTVTGIANAVAKSFKFVGFTNTTLEVQNIDVVNVTDKYVGFMRYEEDSLSWLTGDKIDVHFVAFSSDWQIDDLLEADLFYTVQPSSQRGLAGVITFGECVPKYSYLKFDESMKYEGDGWFSYDYEWKTIEKSSDFLASEETKQIFEQGVFDSWVESTIDDEAKDFISSKQWVLRFAYTSYQENFVNSSLAPYTNIDKSIVGDVSLLRLRFYSNDVLYNLGVVDNMQSGSSDPDNTTKQGVDVNADRFEKLVALILFVLLVVLLWPFVSGLIIAFFKSVWKGIKTVIGWIIGILLWPFKQLFRKK